MNVIWRAQLVSKFLFNHSEYKIMLHRPGCCGGVGEILLKFPERQANLQTHLLKHLERQLGFNIQAIQIHLMLN